MASVASQLQPPCVDQLAREKYCFSHKIRLCLFRRTELDYYCIRTHAQNLCFMTAHIAKSWTIKTTRMHVIKKAANKNNNKRNPPHVVHLDEFFAKLEVPFNWLHLICSAKTCVGDKISCIQAISFAFFDVLHLISSFMV